MKISVIIPTLNRPKFLNKAILSIENQILKPSEIFIVDNNSESNENEELYKLIKRKTSLNIIYLKNNKPIQSLRNDTAHLAKVSKASIIFIPCQNGLSHCPEEFTESINIKKGSEVILKSILDLKDNYNEII